MIRWCRLQSDGPGKSGGFFNLPSLEKKYSERLKVVNACGLGEAYMTPEAGKRNYRIQTYQLACVKRSQRKCKKSA